MTKRELSRWQKQKRQERLALSFVIVTIAAVAGIILFGLWREIWSRPGQVTARVGDTAITLGQLADDMKYQAKVLDTQILMANSQFSQYRTQAQSNANDTTAQFMMQYAQQQMQQLQQERLQIGDGNTALEDIINRELVRQEVLKRGGNVTTADVDAEIVVQFQPKAPDTSSTVTETTTITDTANVTPTPSPTPIPADAWKTNLQQTLQAYKITEPDFRRYSLEPGVWRSKLQAMIATTVVTTAEQVHALQILLPSESEAKDALTFMADIPSITFEELAKARSTDTETKDKGGDMGWFPTGVYSTEFNTAVFALQPGQVSGIISDTLGFHIVKVVEKDAKHALSADLLSSRQSQAYTDWLNIARGSPDIKRSFSADMQKWLDKQIPTPQF